jgi:hypothetical protein
MMLFSWCLFGVQGRVFHGAGGLNWGLFFSSS